LGHGCGYYVLLEGGREDQLAGALKVILVKLRPRRKGEEKKKEKIERTVKGDLEKYNREKGKTR